MSRKLVKASNVDTEIDKVIIIEHKEKRKAQMEWDSTMLRDADGRPIYITSSSMTL